MLISVYLYKDAFIMNVFDYPVIHSVKIVRFPYHMRHEIKKFLKKYSENVLSGMDFHLQYGMLKIDNMLDTNLPEWKP